MTCHTQAYKVLTVTKVSVVIYTSSVLHKFIMQIDSIAITTQTLQYKLMELMQERERSHGSTNFYHSSTNTRVSHPPRSLNCAKILPTVLTNSNLYYYGFPHFLPPFLNYASNRVENEC